jgi:hypothetical protein
VLELTDLADRPYDVDVWGRTSEPEWRVIASHTFAVLLEARFGGADALVKCFLASEHEERTRAPCADPADASDAEAWRSAAAYAARVAGRLLDPVPPADFVVRLKVKPRFGRTG